MSSDCLTPPSLLHMCSSMYAEYERGQTVQVIDEDREQS